MTNKLYKVVGISTHKGSRKVRYAQELKRIITLNKHGDTEIEMFELPYAMNKDDALSYAMENKLFSLENNKNYFLHQLYQSWQIRVCDFRNNSLAPHYQS